MNQPGDNSGDSRTAAITAKKPSSSRKIETRSASESGEISENPLSPVQDAKRPKIEKQSPPGSVGGVEHDIARSRPMDAFFTDLSVIPGLGLVIITPPKITDANDNSKDVANYATEQTKPGSHQKSIMISSDGIEQNHDQNPVLKLDGRSDAGSNAHSFNYELAAEEPKSSDNRKSDLQVYDQAVSTDPLKRRRLLADLTEDERMLQETFCFKTDLTEVVTCLYCYMEGHMREDCPDHICEHCKTNDHPTKDCPDMKGPRKLPFCTVCRDEGHETNACPFSYRWWLGDQEMVPNVVNRTVSTQCYKCASRQHLGDDCPMAPKAQKSIWSSEFVNHFLEEPLPEARLDDSASQMGIMNRHAGRNGFAIEQRDIKPLPKRRRMDYNVNAGAIPPPPTIPPPPLPRDPPPPPPRDSLPPPPPNSYRPTRRPVHQPLRGSGASDSIESRNQPSNQTYRRQAPPPRLGSHVVERSNPPAGKGLRQRPKRGDADHYRPGRR